MAILGIIQLCSLNLGGIFSLFWARGIAMKKPSSRYWILAIHSMFMAICAAGICIALYRPDCENYLNIHGVHTAVGRSWVIAFLLFKFVLYGLPVFLLMLKKVKEQFIGQPGAGCPPHIVAAPDP